MTPEPGVAKLAPRMSQQESPERIVFQVEVEPDTDPITGLLRAGSQEVGFVGWVALAGALERILAAGSGPEGEKTGVSPP
jgi:hypothetical protein